MRLYGNPYTNTATKRHADLLAAGESFLAGAATTSPGSTYKAAVAGGIAGAGSGGVAARVADRTARKAGEAASAEVPPSSPAARVRLTPAVVCATEKRVLWFTRTSITSHVPRDFVAEVATADIVAVDHMKRALRPSCLTLAFVDGSSATVELAKHKRSTEFVERLQENLERRAT